MEPDVTSESFQTVLHRGSYQDEHSFVALTAIVYKEVLWSPVSTLMFDIQKQFEKIEPEKCQ